MIGCPVKTSEEWKKIVKDIKEKFNVDDKKADDLASYAFHTHGEMPTSERAISILEAGVKFTTKKTVKQGITSLFRDRKLKSDAEKGYAFGMAEGKVIGAVEQAKLDKGQPDEALKAQEKERKEFVKLVSEYLNTNEKLRGKLSEAKIDAITRKASNVGTSEKNFNKFADYVDKVISAENYATDLNTSKSNQKKMKPTFSNSADFVNRMKNIDTERLSVDELQKFNELADKYLTSTKKIDEPFEVSPAEKELKELEKSISDSIIKETEQDYGVLGLTKEEADLMNEYMQSETPDEFESLLDEPQKKTLRERLEQLSEYSFMGFKDWAENYKQTVSKNVSDIIDNILNLDVSKITKSSDLADVVKIMNNAIVNNTSAALGKAATIINAYEGVTKMQNSTYGLIKKTIGSIRLAVEDTPILLKAILGSRQAIAAIRLYTGYGKMLLAGSSADKATIKIKNEYKKLRDKYEIDNSPETEATIGIYAKLSDVRKGSENEDFLHNKKQLENSIKRLLKSKNQNDIEYGKMLNNEYEASVAPHESFNEFKSSFEKSNKAYLIPASDFWKESFSKIKQEYKEFSLLNKNENVNFDIRENYTPLSYYSVKQDVTLGTSPEESGFKKEAKKPKETGRTKERILVDGNLPDNKVVDYRMESAMLKAHQDVLFEMGSWEAKQIHAKMTTLEGWSDVFGGEENANAFSDEFNIQYNLLRFGKQNSDGLSRNVAMQLARAAKNIGAPIALGRISQLFSQSTVLFNTYRQTGKYFKQVASTRGLSNLELFKMSTVGYRAEEMGAIGRAESVGAIGYSKLKRTSTKILDDVTNVTGRARDVSMTPLVKADVFAAEKSFLSYYLKYMNDVAKVSVSAKDLPTEHLRIDENRRLAIEYAQQAVDETQGVSNKVQQSKFKRNDGGGTASEIAKSIIMPFNNFASNTKSRMIEDLYLLKNGNEAQKKEANIDLQGSLIETAAFQATSAFLIGSIYQYGIKPVLALAFGIDTEKEDFYDYFSKQFKKFYTGVTREILFSGFGGTMENTGMNALNNAALGLNSFVEKETGNKWDWLGDSSHPLFSKQYTPPKGSDALITLNSLGAYGIAGKTAYDFGSNIRSIATNINTRPVSYEKELADKPSKGFLNQKITISREEERPMSEEERNFTIFLSLIHGLQLVGLTEQDLGRSAQSLKYDIERSSTPAKTSGGGFGKGFSSGGFGKKFK